MYSVRIIASSVASPFKCLDTGCTVCTHTYTHTGERGRERGWGGEREKGGEGERERGGGGGGFYRSAS